ncbi:pyridoxal phosphate-dependent transferase [Aspergillus avenaceus]|uniref:Pyridoxal phosphate-dependent transferase n=1 Tax=Aspergillus avenaceus TaxID=36643 RepID=A0A5N6U9I5_ASPAV|nr:pyridoxal phosphate-dependent transferase [Aspergillus avenaceus]
MWVRNYLLALSACALQATAIEPTGTDHLSPRATKAIELNKGWRSLSENVLSKPYDPERYPDGIINLGLAENWLIQKELAQYLEDHFTIDPLVHMTYGEGAAGSPRLRKALAEFFNDYFNPTSPVHDYEIIVSSGVTSLIDSIAWNTCSDNEGIIIPQPLYNGFPSDIDLRSSAKLLNASYLWEDHEYNLDDVFDPVMIRKSLDRAWDEYAADGVAIRAVMIANPHNPLGRPYSEEGLLEIARFCGEHDIHFVSDEIYANSVFDNGEEVQPPAFTSALSLNLDGIINPELVHVLYGMSKDFGVSGFRLGALVSRNENLIQAAFGLDLLSWPSYIAQDMWAGLLEDKPKTKYFLDANVQRLGDAYGNITEWLDAKQIDYYHDGNAALFIWTHLIPADSTVTPEDLIAECRANGVNVGDGRNFLAEGEPGWFRLTFSYPTDMLLLGLERLEEVLTGFGLLSNGNEGRPERPARPGHSRE